MQPKHAHKTTILVREEGTTKVVQASRKITEKRLKWYGHVKRMKEEHIVRRMLDVIYARCGHTREKKKKRAAKPKMERCM